MMASHTQIYHLYIMKTRSNISPLSILLLFVIFSCSWAASAGGNHDFLQCLSKNLHSYSSISNVVCTPTNSSYTSILQWSIRNLRFMSESTPKPNVIITPEHELQIPPVIYCAKKNDMQIRIRSGGHDFEGLSYISGVPFAVLDLINLSNITVDAEEKTAWVEAGANIGSLYYRIAEKSSILAFPGGICPTIGVGGLFGGGGYGYMMRKYGLAADHVIDARIIDVNGEILDRKSMGEDLFWAIRGGGAASFGVILSWKIQLVDISEKVTVFTVPRTLEQNATQLVRRWQYIAHEFDPELFVGVNIRRVNSSQNDRNMTILASFFSLYVGGVDRLLPLMQESFPELGLVREDCTEMSWIQSMLYFAGFPTESPELLLNRTQAANLGYFKAKSDYVQEPVPTYGLEGIWEQLYEPEADEAQVLMMPYGGRMAEISESAIPFPHRAGNLYKLSSGLYWHEDGSQDSDRYMSWMRRFYSYMTPYVSSSPRAAYQNYRDLDIGVNKNEGETNYAEASIWGKKYFKNNFDRLVEVKTNVDPENFFRHEQSIPPYTLGGLVSEDVETY